MLERKHLRPRPRLHRSLGIAGVAAMRLELAVGEDPAEHGHDVLELAWVERGVLHHRVGASTLEGGPGSLLAVPVGCAHAYRVGAGGAVLWNLAVDQERAALPSLPAPLAAQLSALLPMPGTGPSLCGAVDLAVPLAGILAEQEGRGHAWVQAVGAHLRLLLIAAARAAAAGRLQALAAADPRIVALRQRIDARPERAWDLALLAAEAGLGQAGLVRAFRRAAGCTPGAYVRRARLLAARARIADGDTLADAAAACGYGSAAALARAARRTTGATAASWRRGAI